MCEMRLRRRSAARRNRPTRSQSNTDSCVSNTLFFLGVEMARIITTRSALVAWTSAARWGAAAAWSPFSTRSSEGAATGVDEDDDGAGQWMASAVSDEAVAEPEQWMASAAAEEDAEVAAEPEQWMSGVVSASAAGGAKARDEQVPKGAIECDQQMRIFNKLRKEGRGMRKGEEKRMGDRMQKVFAYRNANAERKKAEGK